MTTPRADPGVPRLPTTSAWRALEESLDGEVLSPGSSGIVGASPLFNARFRRVRPLAVALPGTAADVAECLHFARRHALAVAIRSGGHSYAGWSSGADRFVIDVGRMSGIAVGAEDVFVGAGARLGDIYTSLGARGLTISAGTCPSVGISGLALGGGHGLLSRRFGLTCDNLVEATVVTADGRAPTCSADVEPDLFWALRGAGNGSFGVVTELRLRTHAVGESSSAELRWPWSRAAGVLASWQEWAPDLPDEMWAAIRLQKDDDGLSVAVSAVSVGPPDELARALERLAGGSVAATLRTEPHLGTIRRFEGELDETAPPACYDVRSDFFAAPLPPAAIDAAIATLEHAPVGIDAVVAAVALGGAVNRRQELETSFVHRRHRFLAQYEAHWDPDAADAASADAEAWLRSIHSAMHPHASGEAYQNVPDPRLTDWRQAYYGPALTRLERIKHAFDPERIFDFPHAL